MNKNSRGPQNNRGPKPQNPPRPARRSYDIPPAARVMPGKPGKRDDARTQPGRPQDAPAARTLPGRPPKQEYRPRGEFKPRDDFKSRDDRYPKSDFKPRGDFKPRDDRSPKPDFKPRSDFKPRDDRYPKSDNRPRGEYRPRDDFKPRDDRYPKSDYKPRDDRYPKPDFKPRGDFKPRDDRYPKPDYKPRGDFKPRGDYKPRPDYRPRENFPPADEIAPEDRFPPRGAPEPPENLLAGRNPIREALKGEVPLEKLLVATGDLSGAARDIVKMAKDAGIVVQYVERHRLDQIYPAHQGMLAFRSARAYASIQDILDYARERGEPPLVVALDSVTDPHNLGAIIRSAECAGAHGVVIPERRAAGLTPACEKAAAGALNHMRVARVKNLNRALKDLKDEGLWILAAALEGEDALSADFSGPMALVIGSEGEGISRLTLEICDRSVALPVFGQIESLNASVAAGILLYQVVRARKAGG